MEDYKMTYSIRATDNSKLGPCRVKDCSDTGPHRIWMCIGDEDKYVYLCRKHFDDCCRFSIVSKDALKQWYDKYVGEIP
jgi:hypothetical protein